MLFNFRFFVMSGHSKWATTKRAKAATDAKRSNLFTKLSKNIIIAAKQGADQETNFKLRMAVDKARSFNMPKDNIERAIKRATGEGSDSQMESLFYEAYGPEGVAIIIDVVTDSRNRTVSNLKHLLTKYDGKLGNAGSVMWMFNLQGEILLNKKSLSETEELSVIETGAEDLVIEEEGVKIITVQTELENVKNKLQALGLEIKSSELNYSPKETVVVSDADKLLRLLDALDEDDDVNNLYTNADI